MSKLADLHKVRMFEESDDLIDQWNRPSKRTEAERKIYGPSLVDKKIVLLTEFHKKVHKKPEILEEVRADLAEREAAHPEKSRFRLRLRVIHDHMQKNKKLGMKTKYLKGPGIGLFELFKGRKIVDDIFGSEDLLVKAIEKYNAEQGIVDIPASLGLKKSTPKSVKKTSPGSAKTKKAKLSRCPNGTRRNKKNRKCEPKKK